MRQVLSRKLQANEARLKKEQELSEKKAMAEEAHHKTRVRLIKDDFEREAAIVGEAEEKAREVRE